MDDSFTSYKARRETFKKESDNLTKLLDPDAGDGGSYRQLRLADDDAPDYGARDGGGDAEEDADDDDALTVPGGFGQGGDADDLETSPLEDADAAERRALEQIFTGVSGVWGGDSLPPAARAPEARDDAPPASIATAVDSGGDDHTQAGEPSRAEEVAVDAAMATIEADNTADAADDVAAGLDITPSRTRKGGVAVRARKRRS